MNTPQFATAEAKFPQGFTWGAATAAHQVEGGNWNNDWWEWEHRPDTPCVEPSGDACDHFHRYPHDIALLASLGFDNYRFSVEWSRVEPEEGEFSINALEHYRRMVESCRENGITPVVTLHHFTTPRWVVKSGGWLNETTADLFARYCQRVATHLGDEVGRWCTINEPNVVSTIGQMLGAFPPGNTDRTLRAKCNAVFVLAHEKARQAVKSVSSAPLGITLAMQEFLIDAPDHERKLATAKRDSAWAGLEDPFFEAARGDDFFGVQTYTRQYFGASGRTKPSSETRTTMLGYEFCPESLEACIRRAWDKTGHVPILVTENGIATTQDLERIEYVHRALGGVLRCISDGIDVRGYTYWSLLDNFEWIFGYVPTFGLVGVDRKTQQRVPKPSASWLGRVARANALLPIGLQ